MFYSYKIYYYFDFFTKLVFLTGSFLVNQFTGNNSYINKKKYHTNIFLIMLL